MTDREIVKAALKKRGWSQKKLAEEIGMHSSANVSQALRNRGNGMLTNTLFRMLEAMDYEILIRDKLDYNDILKMNFNAAENSMEDQAVAERDHKKEIADLVEQICSNGDSDILEFINESRYAADLLRICRDLPIPGTAVDAFVVQQRQAVFGDEDQ